VVIDWIEQVSHVMLKVTGYVMALAPIAVFAAMASIVTTQGLGILWTYGKFMGEFYFGILILWGCSSSQAFSSLVPRIGRLVTLIASRSCSRSARRAARLRIRRRSSKLERFGASKKITSFVLPLGYSFNLDGSMMYCTFARCSSRRRTIQLDSRSRSRCC
jgi:Na+/H+-dicarboxylate symporter